MTQITANEEYHHLLDTLITDVQFKDKVFNQLVDGSDTLRSELSMFFMRHAHDSVLDSNSLFVSPSHEDMRSLKLLINKVMLDDDGFKAKIQKYLGLAFGNIQMYLTALVGIALLNIHRNVLENTQSMLINEYETEVTRQGFEPSNSKAPKSGISDSSIFLWQSYDNLVSGISTLLVNEIKKGVDAHDWLNIIHVPEANKSIIDAPAVKNLTHSSQNTYQLFDMEQLKDKFNEWQSKATKSVINEFGLAMVMSQYVNNVARIQRTEGAKYDLAAKEECFSLKGVNQVMFINEIGACKFCMPQLFKKMSLKKAEKMLPIHPNCRCTIVENND